VFVTATVDFAEDDGAPEGRIPGGGSFVDSLVGQLHAEYGVDPQAIRSRAAEVLATFAGARVQVFVPILVEKRLRELYRARGTGLGPAAVEETVG
jgi:hypothetical protein